MTWLLYLVVAALSVSWLVWRYRNRRLLAMATKIPGPPTIPFLGNALSFICQPEEFVKMFLCWRIKYGDVYRVWLGPDLHVVVSNPDDLKVLLTNTKMSFKGPQYKYMADLIGVGLFSGSGTTWRRHRKIAKPSYGKRAIDGYSDVFNKEVHLLLQKMRKESNQLIDIFVPIAWCTTQVVCQTLMGLTKEQTISLPHIEEIIDQTLKAYDIVFSRMTKWYLQIDPVFWVTNFHKEQKHFMKMTSEFSDMILRNRADKLKIMVENNHGTELLNGDTDVGTQLCTIDRFILSKELNPQELLEETFTVFTSSQDPPAKLASLIILMMAYHPKCQEKLYAEIISVLGDMDRPITDEDIRQMPYLEMVFKEALRLFPIGAMLQRTINEDITISSCTLPAGCSLMVPIYHMHRDPTYWTDPDLFNPERFSPDNMKSQNPNAYLPFSLGPMDCLGRFFAIKIVKIISIRLLQEFKVTSPETYEDLRVIISIGAIPLNGYNVLLQPRKSIDP